jgi:hypothetical protein
VKSILRSTNAVFVAHKKEFCVTIKNSKTDVIMVSHSALSAHGGASPHILHACYVVGVIA